MIIILLLLLFILLFPNFIFLTPPHRQSFSCVWWISQVWWMSWLPYWTCSVGFLHKWHYAKDFIEFLFHSTWYFGGLSMLLSVWFVAFFFFLDLCIYLRERSKEWVREGQRVLSRFRAEPGAWCRAQSMNPRSWPEPKPKSQRLSRLCPPGAPSLWLCRDKALRVIYRPKWNTVEDKTLH